MDPIEVREECDCSQLEMSGLTGRIKEYELSASSRICYKPL